VFRLRKPDCDKSWRENTKRTRYGCGHGKYYRDRQCFDEHHSAANVWGGDKFTAEGMRYRTFPLNFTSVDENYIPTLKVQLLFGRNLSKEIPGDESRVFLNETAVEQIGWTLDESVVRKKFNYPALVCSLK